MSKEGVLGGVSFWRWGGRGAVQVRLGEGGRGREDVAPHEGDALATVPPHGHAVNLTNPFAGHCSIWM